MSITEVFDVRRIDRTEVGELRFPLRIVRKLANQLDDFIRLNRFLDKLAQRLAKLFIETGQTFRAAIVAKLVRQARYDPAQDHRACDRRNRLFVVVGGVREDALGKSGEAQYLCASDGRDRRSENQSLHLHAGLLRHQHDQWRPIDWRRLYLLADRLKTMVRLTSASPPDHETYGHDRLLSRGRFAVKIAVSRRHPHCVRLVAGAESSAPIAWF